jgi:uncharacterized membrane-anchored protein
MVRVRIAMLRRSRRPALPGVTAVARVGPRTRLLAKRLRRGEIAVIDHVDIDRVAAEALVESGVAGVVNAATSISGRYPNLGPEILVAHGIALLDSVGSSVLAEVHDGDIVRLDGNTLYAGDRVIATGEQQTIETVQLAMAHARDGMAVQLEAFASNTLEYLRRDRDLLFDGVGLPEIRTDLANKHVLVMVRGYNYREDLIALKRYIHDYRPVLIGVDGGVDVLLENGYQPAVIVGDVDALSDAALRSGAEIVLHTSRDGRTTPTSDRLRNMGLQAVEIAATGTSEDVALLLADSKGASVIVTVGTHATLVEFLDKGRSGMASTFLTRLRIGGKLVDAKGLSRLYRPRISTSALLVLVSAALLVVAVVLGPGVLRNGALKNQKAQNAQLQAQAQNLQTQNDTLSAQIDADQAFAHALGPVVVAGRLAGKSVVVVTLPGASKDLTTALTKTLVQAGATLTGEVDLTAHYADPAQATSLSSLVQTLSAPAATATGASSAAPSAVSSTGPSASAPAASPPGASASPNLAAQAGSLLAAALVAAPGSTSTAASPTEVLAGLAKGGFITTSGPLTQLATLALVVAPMQAGSGSSDTTGQALLGLVTAFPAAGGPAVVVGPSGSASGGVLAAVRSSAAAGKTVSTVDDADDVGGDISVVLALQNASLGGVGQFGTGPGARGSVAAPSTP